MIEREKQIEEIFRDLCNAPTGGVREDFTIRTLTESHSDAFIRIVAGHLASLNYRKQSEGEWKIMKMGDGERVRTCSSCLISQSVNVYKGKVMFRYCPYCGAKMSGGTE